MKKQDDKRIEQNEKSPPPKLIEGEDYYFEDDLMVFTREYHLKRGSCCNSGCRHCPYKPKLT